MGKKLEIDVTRGGVRVAGRWRDVAVSAAEGAGERTARVFFSSDGWSLHRFDAAACTKSRHDSREYALRMARAWVRS